MFPLYNINRFQKDINWIYRISDTPPLGKGIKKSIDNNIKPPMQTEKNPFLTWEKLLRSPKKKTKKLYDKKNKIDWQFMP